MMFKNIEYTPSGVGTERFNDQSERYDSALKRYISQQGMGDQIQSQKLQERNKLIQAEIMNNMANQFKGIQGEYMNPMQQPMNPMQQPMNQEQPMDPMQQPMDPMQQMNPNAQMQPIDPMQQMQQMDPNAQMQSKKGSKENPWGVTDIAMIRQLSSKMFGDQFAFHTYTDEDGKQLMVTPLGIVDTGISSFELNKNLAKHDASRIAELDSASIQARDTLLSLGEINDILGSPAFKDMRTMDFLGKSEINLLKIKGTPEQKELIGRLESYMGNIVAESSQRFKGAFRAGEQALVQSMKPSISDTLNSMKGKSAAMTYLAQMIEKRSSLESELMRENGLSYQKAKDLADKIIDPDEVKSETDRILNAYQDDDLSEENLRYTAEAEGITVEQLKKHLGI